MFDKISKHKTVSVLIVIILILFGLLIFYINYYRLYKFEISGQFVLTETQFYSDGENGDYSYEFNDMPKEFINVLADLTISNYFSDGGAFCSADVAVDGEVWKMNGNLYHKNVRLIHSVTYIYRPINEGGKYFEMIYPQYSQDIYLKYFLTVSVKNNSEATLQIDYCKRAQNGDFMLKSDFYKATAKVKNK